MPKRLHVLHESPSTRSSSHFYKAHICKHGAMTKLCRADTPFVLLDMSCRQVAMSGLPRPSQKKKLN